ncbi:TPA: hypothetical protein WJA41_001498 [Neisseria meningitidis]|nr:hypothetical protein [Neisseria meningitidis]MCL4979122.1 hypothetical protein [Neisseria meningitidis]MCL4999238.1 hypothetical protein [Neisseria meningitidis]MCL5764270.1 hypothetical protein [Neisseria meningitidis]MCL5865248.1 hypothetical protein [Neisseria meningitidis]MCL5917051.1 hypothetical protein [Neisseria meningitidis]
MTSPVSPSIRAASIFPLARSISTACRTDINRLPLRLIASTKTAEINLASSGLSSVLPASLRRLRVGLTLTASSLRYKVAKLIFNSPACCFKYALRLPLSSRAACRPIASSRSKRAAFIPPPAVRTAAIPAPPFPEYVPAD